MILRDMKIGFLLSLKGIRRNKTLFMFTSLIITFGFINVFFFTSFLSGMSYTLNKQLIDKQWGNIIINPSENEDYIQSPDRILDKVRRIPGVTGATKRLRLRAVLENEAGDKIVAPWYFQGIDPADEKSVTDLQDFLKAGHYLTENDDDSLMISAELVGKGDGLLLPKEDTLESEIGDKIVARYENGAVKTYKLKAILDPKDIYAVVSGYITFREAERILNVSDKASFILLRVPTGTEKQYVRKLKELGINEQILTWEDKAMTTKVITDSFEIINKLFRVVGLFIVFITVVIIIYINILNNRKKIGILKAVGIKNSTVIYSYLSTSFFYGLVGIVLGSIIVFFLFEYLQQNPVKGPLGDMAPVFDLGVYIISSLLIFASSLLGALIPAFNVVRKNIIELVGG